MNPNTGLDPADGPRRRRVSNYTSNLPLATPRFASFFRGCVKVISFGKNGYETVRSAVIYAKERIGPAIAEATRGAVRRIRQWAVENPKLSATITFVFFAVVPGSIIAFLMGSFLYILIGWLGFSAVGPIAGSVAASLQATFGNVGARSLFAIIQSAAMGGYGAALMNVFVRIGGAIGGVAAGLWSTRRGART